MAKVNLVLPAKCRNRATTTYKIHVPKHQIHPNKIQKTIPQANCQLVVMGDNYLPDYIPFTVHPEKGLIKAPVQIRVCISRKYGLLFLLVLLRVKFYIRM